MENALMAVFGGGIAVTIIETIRAGVAWIVKRKAQKNDRKEQKAEAMTEERIAKLEKDVSEIKDLLSALAESQKTLLFDRIRHLCCQYIADGEIDFEDRRAVNALHNSYHNGLGGNGDLDALMQQVRSLPLKKK